MPAGIVIWLAKVVAEWAIGRLAHHLGYDNAVVHIQTVLENAKPLKPEVNPPLSKQNNPNSQFIP